MEKKKYLNDDTFPEFAGQIIDILEDWCTENDIIIRNTKRETDIAEGNLTAEDAAAIYGEDYEYLESFISALVYHAGLFCGRQIPEKDPLFYDKFIPAELIVDEFHLYVLSHGIGPVDCAFDDADADAELKEAVKDTFVSWELVATA